MFADQKDLLLSDVRRTAPELALFDYARRIRAVGSSHINEFGLLTKIERSVKVSVDKQSSVQKLY